MPSRGFKIAEGFLEVHVDTDPARRGLRRFMSELAGIRAKPIDVDADTSPFLNSVRAAMQRIAGEKVKVAVDVDDSGARGEVTRATKVAGAGQAVKVPLKIDSKDVTGFTGQLGKFNTVVKAGSNLMQGMKFPVMLNGLRAATGAVGTLSPALVGLAGNLSRVSGLIPAMGVGLAAIGQGMGVVKLATSGLKDALSAAWEGGPDAAQKMDEALKGMDPSARALVGVLGSFKPVIEGLRNTAQAGLFPGVSQALETVRPLLGSFSGVVGDTARAMGGLAIEGAEMARELGGELRALGAGNIPILQSLGRAAISFAPALVRIGIAAQPLAQWMADLAEQGARWSIGASAAAESSGRLAAFFDRAKRTTQQLGGILAGLGGGLFNIAKAGSSAGDSLMVSLGRAMDGFRRWTAIPENQALLRRLADTGADLTRALGKLATEGLLAVLRSADKTGPSLIMLVDKARTTLIPAFERLTSVIDGRVLSSLMELGAQVMDLIGTFGGFWPIMEPIFKAFTLVLEFINKITTTVPGASSVVGTLGSAFAAFKMVKFLADMNAATGVMGGVARLFLPTGAAGKIMKGLDLLKAKAAQRIGVHIGASVAAEGVEGAGEVAATRFGSGLKGRLPSVLKGLGIAAMIAAAVKGGQEIEEAVQGAGWFKGLKADTEREMSGVAGVISGFAGFVKRIPIVGDLVEGLIEPIGFAIAQGGQAVFNFFAGVPGRISGLLSGVVPQLFGQGTRWMGGLLGGLGAGFGAVAGFVGSIGGRFMGMLRSAGSWLIGAGQSSMRGLASGIQIGAGMVWSFIGSIPGRVRGMLASAGGWLVGAGGQALHGLARGMHGAAGAVWGFLGSIGGRVRGALGGAGGWLVGAGQAIIDGLVSGISRGAGRVVGAVQNVLAQARRLLPFSDAKEGPFSDLMASGRSVPRTIAKGVLAGKSDIAAALSKTLPNLTGFGAAPGPQAAPGAPAVAPSIDIDAIARAIGAAVARALEGTAVMADDRQIGTLVTEQIARSLR